MACMTRPFVKMNGAGNDFVVVNALEQPFAPAEDQIRALGDRQTGEGFDQLIAIEPSETADAFMRVWNADGSMVETCGNALRCVGWLLMQANGADRVVIDTAGGPTVATRAGDHRVTVDMGRPRLDWTQVPLAEEMDTRGIELQVGPIDDPVLHTPGAVSMGNPHVVFFTDRQDDGFVTGSARWSSITRCFRKGSMSASPTCWTATTSACACGNGGAGLTQACGTGACAALVATARRGLTERKATVVVDGGELVIDWDAETDHVLMTGPVEIERTGVLPL